MDLKQVLKDHALWLKGKKGQRADLRRANLEGADLEGANLRKADLWGANLRGANLGPRSLVPETGSFICFKKLRGGVIATLEVPSKAKRTSSLVGRKCRAEYVYVLKLENSAGAPVLSACDMRTNAVTYRPNTIIRPDKYDPDVRVECAHGIHFFLTKQEAKEY